MCVCVCVSMSVFIYMCIKNTFSNIHFLRANDCKN